MKVRLDELRPGHVLEGGKVVRATYRCASDERWQNVYVEGERGPWLSYLPPFAEVDVLGPIP